MRRAITPLSSPMPASERKLLDDFVDHLAGDTTPWGQVRVAREYCQRSDHSFVGAVGRGAFKETFEVRNQAGEAVALKIYRPGFSVQRTEREIAAMRKCAHPSIARLFSVAPFDLSGASYLV